MKRFWYCLFHNTVSEKFESAKFDYCKYFSKKRFFNLQLIAFQIQVLKVEFNYQE